MQPTESLTDVVPSDLQLHYSILVGSVMELCQQGAKTHKVAWLLKCWWSQFCLFWDQFWNQFCKFGYRERVSLHILITQVSKAVRVIM